MLRYVVLAPMSAITYKSVFPRIKEGRLWLGRGFRHGDAYFVMQDGSTVHFRNCTWLASVPHRMRDPLPPLHTAAWNLEHHTRLRKWLQERGLPTDAYPRSDNYDAIEVPFTDAIPSDYDGAMGVPISFLDKWEHPGAYEVVGSFNAHGAAWVGHGALVPSADAPCMVNGKQVLWNGPVVAGSPLYKRVVIRRRPETPC